MKLGSLIDNVASGLATAVTLTNLLYCVIGVTLGTFLGVLPGIGGLVSLSLLFPITFHLEPTAALIMLAGIVYGTTYGGSTASILLNVPGTPSSAVACIEAIRCRSRAAPAWPCSSPRSFRSSAAVSAFC